MKHDKVAATVIAGILLPDAVLHLFWAATGSSWPAASQRGLSRGLLNVDVSFAPQNLIVIASMPITAATLVLVHAGMFDGLGRRMPAWIPRLGVLALTAGVSLRLAAGIVWIIGIGADPSSAFYWLNLTVYTPLCVVLAIASTVVLRTRGHARQGDDNATRRSTRARAQTG